MRVALDATPLTPPTGGIRRYVEELSRALVESFPDDRFLLVSDQPFMPVKCVESSRGPRRGLDRRWWLYGVQREMARRSIDVFHGTDFAVPYLALRPSVLTLHDLSPWKSPEWQSDARVRRRTPWLLKLGIATMVITPSEAIRREAIEHFGTHSGRIVAVPEAAASRFQPVVAPPRPAPYFLFVGTLEPRKNLGMLVDAWREVRRSIAVDLVLAGRRRADFPPLSSEPGLHLPGQVPDDDLPALYSGAVACVYPTLYEGFGLPVLEAMQCGAPVIASRDPAIVEVAGDAAALVPASDGRNWAEAMTAAATNELWRAERRKRSLARAALFSWAATARRTREVYQEGIARFA